MIKGIDISQRIEFVSVSDKDDPKTIFVFRPLSSIEMMELAGDAIDGSIKIAGSKIFDYLEKCIVEIKNFPIAENQIMKVRQQLESMPMSVLTELIREMDNINKISAEERKN